MSAVDEQLESALAACPGANRLLLAFSGGLDSSVLLHALGRYVGTRPWLEARAVHVHHGLQAGADAWVRHCRSACARSGLNFDVYFAALKPGSGESEEALARRARYHLFEQCMQPNDVLLTAHHADDQLETLLMRCLRGSGTRGLAGIPALRPFACGQLLRPLIALPRAELRRYARSHELDFVEDPSNFDERFDRGFLRRQVLGPVKRRWPGVLANVTRTARHLAGSEALLGDLAAIDLDAARVGDHCLSVRKLRELSGARRDNLLRHWIAQKGFTLPSSARLASVARNVIDAAHDAEPLVAWPGAELRRYRDRLYLMAPLPNPPPPHWLCNWDIDAMINLPGRAGRLRAVSVTGPGIDRRVLAEKKVTVRFRAGGERLRPAGARHHKMLNRLFQERGIVPWMRARVPLVFVGEELAAVADICWAEQFATTVKGEGVHFAWDGHPPL